MGKLVPSETLKTLYFSFIYPYLTYCNIIWGGTFSGHLEGLKTLQKRAVRIINAAPYLAHSNELFFNSHLLKLDDIHKLSVASFMFKHNSRELYNRNHNYATRNSNLLLPFYRRLTSTQHSLNYIGPIVWNSLPDYIRSANSIESFKFFLKNHLISAYVPNHISAS